MRADRHHRLRQSSAGHVVPGIDRKIDHANAGIGDLIDHLRPHQPAIGRQINPEALLRRVVDDLVREVGTQQRLATHQRQHAGAGVAQPVDRALGRVLGHAANAVVEGPAVMAVEVALPLVEQVRDDRVEVARQNTRANPGEGPAAHGAVDMLHAMRALAVRLREVVLVRAPSSAPDTAGTRVPAASAPCRPGGGGSSRGVLRRLHQQVVQLNIETMSRGCGRPLG